MNKQTFINFINELDSNEIEYCCLDLKTFLNKEIEIVIDEKKE